MNAETQDRDHSPGWQESSVEDWQAEVDRLQELVCILLFKNQTLRTTLLIERSNEATADSV